ALNLPPSPPCSDNEFIRRAYLDACGILPKPEEVAKFLADRGADKRARLIDALLERPEVVDYWAYKWSDVLLITTRRLPQPAGGGGVVTGREAGGGGQQAVGPLRARRADGDGEQPPQRGGELLRAAQGRQRRERGDGDHVHGHVADVRPLPQPPAGALDAGPVLADGQPVFARRAEERRGRRGAGAVAAGRRRDAPAPRRGAAAGAARWQAAVTGGHAGPAEVPRRLADGAGEPVLREGAGQPRVAQLPRPGAGGGGGRPARDEPADERGAARRAGEGLRQAPLRRQGADAHDHELGDVPALVAPGRRERGGRPLLLALPGPPAVRRGDPRCVFAGDRRADAVHAPGHQRPRRRDALRRLPAGHAGAAAAGLAGRFALPRRVRPAGAGEHLLVRAVAGLDRGAGAAPEQRQDAQRQAAREGFGRRAVAGG